MLSKFAPYINGIIVIIIIIETWGFHAAAVLLRAYPPLKREDGLHFLFDTFGT